MSKRNDSRIQREADEVIVAIHSDLKYIAPVMVDHGNVIRYRLSGGNHVWRFEDGFEKEIDKGHG